MGLETGTFVNDLVVTNPPNTDPESQGAAHLRLIKSVLKNTFPNATQAFTFPGFVTHNVNYSVQVGDAGSIIGIDASPGTISVTLPSLTGLQAGWSVRIVKLDGGPNPLLIFPPSGTLVSGSYGGVTSARRGISGGMFEVFWTGGVFYVTRAARAPLGSVVPFFGGIGAPQGFVYCNGQALSSALYPEYNFAIGAVAPDLRGRTVYGHDDGASRLTQGGAFPDGLGSAGGAEYHVLTIGEMPSHTHTASDTGHSHPVTGDAVTLAYQVTGQGSVPFVPFQGHGPSQGTYGPTDTSHAIISVDPIGSNVAHTNVSPGMKMSWVVTVE